MSIRINDLTVRFKNGVVAVNKASLELSLIHIYNDPQGHLTIGLGFSKKQRVTLKTVLENQIEGLEHPLKGAILNYGENLDIIPANKTLGMMGIYLSTVCLLYTSRCV